MPGPHGTEAGGAGSAASTQDGGTSVPTCETHALCPTSAAQVSQDFCKSSWEPSRGDSALRRRYHLLLLAVSPYTPAKRCTGSAQLVSFTTRPACNTSCGRRTEEVQNAGRQALRPFYWPAYAAGWAYMSIGPWTMSVLGNWYRKEEAHSAHWALSAVNQSDIRRWPRSRLVDWRNVFLGRGGRASE